MLVQNEDYLFLSCRVLIKCRKWPNQSCLLCNLDKIKPDETGKSSRDIPVEGILRPETLFGHQQVNLQLSFKVKILNLGSYWFWLALADTLQE